MTYNMPVNLKISLCLQDSLLGMIKPALRGVYFKLDLEVVDVKMIYAEPITEEDIEIASEIEAEMYATFYDIYRIVVTPIESDEALNKITVGYEAVFRRRET